ncbi:uncharacterized protein [Lepisosteus oculatus]|uniref:uncharacterized protein n=1 Tax=Lepisosteus oculatus TaxID=7918 RepID=UPI0037246356
MGGDIDNSVSKKNAQMAFLSKINGFTSWANIRLMESGHHVNNVVKDLFTDTNLKALLESYTGKTVRRMQSMDGLTQQQVITRVEWFVDELKKAGVVPEHDIINCYAIATTKNPKHVFDLLWKLITHDIWFIWEYSRQPLLADDKLLCVVPFKWTPEAPATGIKPDSSLGVAQPIHGEPDISKSLEESGFLHRYDPAQQVEIEPSPGQDLPETYNSKLLLRSWKSYPSPDQCILDMVNTHLQMAASGKKLKVNSLKDLMDGHIMCSLVNSFLPGTFTTEVLLNDRWTVNLALKTMEDLLKVSASFTSEGLSQADSAAVCAYMCCIFMAGYKYKQYQAVQQAVKNLRSQIAVINSNLQTFPPEILELGQFQQKSELQLKLLELQKENERLHNFYDVEECQMWAAHAEKVQKKMWKCIRNNMRTHFETVTVPRNATLANVCQTLAINLSLTAGTAFHLTRENDTVPRNRRAILQNKETGEFIVDTSRSQRHGKEINLCQSNGIYTSSKPSHLYKIFLEIHSKNKILKRNTVLLYQVFPRGVNHWRLVLFKFLKSKDYDAVRNVILFLRKTYPEVINSQDPSNGNAALHLASKNGHFETILLLLESGASADLKNISGCTPFFLAAAGQHRSVCMLLIEWGCEIHIDVFQSQGISEGFYSKQLKEDLLGYAKFWSSAIPTIMKGNTSILYNIAQKTMEGNSVMASLRSRCINGSTVLHTAAYFGDRNLIDVLLALQVDVNLLDYKGATPLHRSRDAETIQFLIDRGADINRKDDDGNTPIHVVCYGEPGKDTNLDCVRLLLSHTTKPPKPNKKGLFPIHCAAIQGRTDVIKLLMQFGSDGQFQRNIVHTKTRNSPSLLYLSVANGHLQCAEWLAARSFTFKPAEQEELLHGLLQEEIAINEKVKCLEFLIKSGVDVNAVYTGGDSALHLCALRPVLNELLASLLDHGAEVNKLNDEHCTPLFCAVCVANLHGANFLLKNGSEVMHRNNQGLTAFDYIHNYDEWIKSGLFTEEINALLKAYYLKQTRSLVRGISRKLNLEESKPRSFWIN